jgi:DNA end-binding protein Ku
VTTAVLTPPASPAPEKVAPTAFRSTWSGTVTCGLLSLPVKVFVATQENDLRFKQVHTHGDDEPGFIKQKRFCSGCNEEVAYGDMEKGFEAPEGLVLLTSKDIDAIPLDSTKAISVQEFVPMASVDPIMHEKTYYVTPANEASKKAYALLRDGLADTGRGGVVKVTMRQREQVALLHVRDSGFGVPVLALTTLRWSDEIRHASMPILQGMPQSAPAELAMAKMLIDSLASDHFNPDAYEDGYRAALQEVIESKRAGITPPATAPAKDNAAKDLMALLKASVENAKQRREAA